MKNKILFLMVLVLVTALSGCKKVTTAGFTQITYYPTLEVLGDPVVITPLGIAYVDAGAKAVLQGEDVSSEIVTTSNVDSNVGGVYTVSYKITNKDGYSRSASRTVYVADTTPSVITTGIHTVAAGTNRVVIASGVTVNYSGYPVLLLQTAPGVFYISDFLGGYYDKRAGYGSNYAMTGYFKVNADNTLSLISSHIIGWGDSLDELNNASVDPVTGKITFSAVYAGSYSFNVILN
jgi:BT_2262-like, C-terminal domain/Bacterial surface protein, Ig-like domain